MVDGSIASLNVALMEEAVETDSALFGGDVDSTVGGCVSGPVLKFQIWSLCSAFPARSFAPVVMVTV